MVIVEKKTDIKRKHNSCVCPLPGIVDSTCMSLPLRTVGIRLFAGRYTELAHILNIRQRKENSLLFVQATHVHSYEDNKAYVRNYNCTEILQA